MNIKIISAGAGSGKTYRLTSEMVRLLKEGVRASGVIATTFTQKAAAELQERVRVRLLEEGLHEQADDLTNALIGTVHGLGVKLLKRFAYEAGVSPEVDIIAEEDQQVLFNQALATVLTEERVMTMESLGDRLGLSGNEYFDWRTEVRQLTEVARANDFSAAGLERSKERSFESFRSFLGEEDPRSEETFNRELAELLDETIRRLENNEDGTKVTQNAVNTLKSLHRELKLRGELFWPDWARLSKLKVGARSRDDIEALLLFAQSHHGNRAFHHDIRAFINAIFDLAAAAIQEYDDYKKRRGLIDYTDMEVLVKRLLDHPQVVAVMREEIDLLLVDEFQDTSPIQLEIFLKLSQLATYSIWVGDPKQSIYGFRGADPRLMQAIIEKVGGVRPEDIQEWSWRSREDIVYLTNALFTKAFDELPPEQVALKPRRRKAPDADSVNKEPEPIEMDEALWHWHFEYEGEGRRQPGRPWMENCIAATLQQWLGGRRFILPKGEKNYRQPRPGDVAILCRSNRECEQMAEALANAGFRVAIARAGLLNTAEAKLILAVLKYILHRPDSLSIAELLLLAEGWTTERIIEHRLDYLAAVREGTARHSWAAGEDIIRRIDELRDRVVELSSAELLNVVLEELDLRRSILSWGNAPQRLDNIDVLRRLALQYEEACNRLHTAASLAGFLLWLGDLAAKGEDRQGSGEGPGAVNVLTYHRSKGLEWPVVICHSLEKGLRADLWGIDIIPESEEVDLNDILGRRWLRYWVNPYGRQYRGTTLEEQLEQSEAKAIKVAQSTAEEARLLYVGITRARDYLILPSSRNPTKWLNRVWHGNDETPTLDHHTHESPWHWNDHFLNLQTEVMPFPKDFPQQEYAEETVTWQEARAGRQPHRPYLIDLSRESLTTDHIANIGLTTTYGPGLPLPDEADTYQTAKLIKAFLTAFYPDRPQAEQQVLARSMIGRFGAVDAIEESNLLQLGQQYFGYLYQNFSIRAEHRKYPLRYQYRGRLFETVADLVLETDRGLLLFQNSGYAGADKKWKNHALSLADWLFLGRQALQVIFDEPRVRTFVHFVLGGTVVEVETGMDGH